MATDMTENVKTVDFKTAAKAYAAGKTVLVTTKEDGFENGVSMALHRDKKTFSELMNEWYMFNHWSESKPKPVFFVIED